MLLELTIRDFAIIEQLRLPLDPHFNIFTGETGAGKSIIIDAVSALLGEKMSADLVRTGAERAFIEGIFAIGELPPAPARQQTDPDADGPITSDDGDPRKMLAALLAAYGLESDDQTLILTREIHRSGRTTARINGRAMPLAVLQQIGGLLVDIHGQGEHLSLLRPEQHINFLDRYANLLPRRRELSALVAAWHANRRELATLQQDERELERRIDLLRFQVEEINAARLQPGEIAALERERTILNNAERLRELCATVSGTLSSAADMPAVLDLIGVARRALGELARLDPQFAEQVAAIEEISYRLEDIHVTVRDYLENIESDPERLTAIEDRLDLINRLKRKYGPTIEDILRYGANAAAELERYTHRGERLLELQERDTALRAEIGACAAELAAAREEAARSLATAMERELNDLNMRRARFQVDIRRRLNADGAIVTPAQARGSLEPGVYAFDATGIDQVQFLIAPNPGEPFKPLARIASGGETSRLMLALKSILSAADATPTLIFDEIDAGISGRSGQIVGEKLWRLASNHQVICITHLPQIAALADRHFNVSKEIVNDRTVTLVHELDRAQQAIEISQMLGGTLTEKTRQAALELLHAAETKKHAADTL
jgi:DNA repair protein RecN (Recombination protein N)